jgi:hypothetical protein
MSAPGPSRPPRLPAGGSGYRGEPVAQRQQPAHRFVHKVERAPRIDDRRRLR